MTPRPEEEPLPYDPKARAECQWQEDGIKDHFGLHKFLPYP